MLSSGLPMSAIIYMENFSKKNPHDGDRRREKLIKVKVCRYISFFFHPACFLFTNKVENKKFIFILNSTTKICFTHSVADFGGSKWGQFIVIITGVPNLLEIIIFLHGLYCKVNDDAGIVSA